MVRNHIVSRTTVRTVLGLAYSALPHCLLSFHNLEPREARMQEIVSTAMARPVQETLSLVGETALVVGGTEYVKHTMAMAMAEAGADVLLVQVSVSMSHRFPNPWRLFMLQSYADKAR